MPKPAHTLFDLEELNPYLTNVPPEEQVELMERLGPEVMRPFKPQVQAHLTSDQAELDGAAPATPLEQECCDITQTLLTPAGQKLLHAKCRLRLAARYPQAAPQEQAALEQQLQHELNELTQTAAQQGELPANFFFNYLNDMPAPLLPQKAAPAPEHTQAPTVYQRLLAQTLGTRHAPMFMLGGGFILLALILLVFRAQVPQSAAIATHLEQLKHSITLPVPSARLSSAPQGAVLTDSAPTDSDPTDSDLTDSDLTASAWCLAVWPDETLPQSLERMVLKGPELLEQEARFQDLGGSAQALSTGSSDPERAANEQLLLHYGVVPKDARSAAIARYYLPQRLQASDYYVTNRDFDPHLVSATTWGPDLTALNTPQLRDAVTQGAPEPRLHLAGCADVIELSAALLSAQTSWALSESYDQTQLTLAVSALKL